MSLIVIMVSRVSAYVQTHQTVHIQYMQVFADQLYLNKAGKHGLSPGDYRKQNGNYEKKIAISTSSFNKYLLHTLVTETILGGN